MSRCAHGFIDLALCAQCSDPAFKPKVLPDPKAPGFTYTDARSTPVAEEFIELRSRRAREKLAARRVPK